MEGRQFCSVIAMPSHTEARPPLSLSLRQQLAGLVHAFDRGPGPVEYEARQRLAEGYPMTSLQVRSFAEECYPAEVRNFLDALQYQSLCEGDIKRALAVGRDLERGASRRAAVATTGRGRSSKLRASSVSSARLAIFAMAVLLGAALLPSTLPKIRRADDLPEPPAMDPKEYPQGRPAGESMCLKMLRDSAVIWCESALTGTPASNGVAHAKPKTCGDTLRAHS